jgi:hypothetical protein
MPTKDPIYLVRTYRRVVIDCFCGTVEPFFLNSVDTSAKIMEADAKMEADNLIGGTNMRGNSASCRRIIE